MKWLCGRFIKLKKNNNNNHFVLYFYLFCDGCCFFSPLVQDGTHPSRRHLRHQHSSPNQWLIDCPSSRHGHTSVSLTVTKKKQEYKLGFTVWLWGQENRSLTIMTQIHHWFFKTPFLLLPLVPLSPFAWCVCQYRYVCIFFFFLFGWCSRTLGLGAVEDILTAREGLRRKPVSGFAVYWLQMWWELNWSTLGDQHDNLLALGLQLAVRVSIQLSASLVCFLSTVKNNWSHQFLTFEHHAVNIGWFNSLLVFPTAVWLSYLCSSIWLLCIERYSFIFAEWTKIPTILKLVEFWNIQLTSTRLWFKISFDFQDSQSCDGFS